jgi:hypothetical protein
MNDLEKDDYLCDRRSAMTRLMQEPPEESLMRAYDEGYKMGIYKATTRMLSDVNKMQEIIDIVKKIKKWEGEHG